MASVAFSRGAHTLSVPTRLFALNRQRLCAALKDAGVEANNFVLLQGGNDVPRYNTDVNYTFRQESFFHWSFGVEEPDFYGAVNVSDGTSILFMPKLPDSYMIWCGAIHGPEHFQKKYEVDEVYYTHDIAKVLKEKNASQILLLHGKNTDSGLTINPPSFDGINDFKIETDKLYPIIAELRVFKTDLELDVIRYICQVSCDAHVKMMKACKPGLYEYQLESLFIDHCYYYGGARCLAYTCIAASGCNCSVLHYGHAGAPNNKKIKDGDLCLFDMGAEYCCYASDITTTFPANGKFTDDQKLIYNAVLKSNRAVMKAAKPGASWVDMHLLSQRTILECLLEGGLLKGNVDDMMKVHLGAVFMPHGLGHFMGLDVHDVNGYPKGVERVNSPSLSNLRTARVLQHGMVITIEPGCYFNDFLIDAALKDERGQFMVESVINRFRGTGGVRIEDDVLITATGTENLSPVVRDIAAIEAIMSGK
jgi:Xaa-Pro dipeptidase